MRLEAERIEIIQYGKRMITAGLSKVINKLNHFCGQEAEN